MEYVRTADVKSVQMDRMLIIIYQKALQVIYMLYMIGETTVIPQVVLTAGKKPRL